MIRGRQALPGAAPLVFLAEFAAVVEVVRAPSSGMCSSRFFRPKTTAPAWEGKRERREIEEIGDRAVRELLRERIEVLPDGVDAALDVDPGDLDIRPADVGPSVEIAVASERFSLPARR